MISSAGIARVWSQRARSVDRRNATESVLSGRKTAADMARLYDISQPTVSRIVAQHRRMSEPADAQP